MNVFGLDYVSCSIAVLFVYRDRVCYGQFPVTYLYNYGHYGHYGHYMDLSMLRRVLVRMARVRARVLQHGGQG